MSKIFGFNYWLRYGFDKYSEYIILSKVNQQYWINFASENNINKVEITEKIDEICNRFEKMSIQEWNMRYFDAPMEFFPNFEWRLNIHTDTVNVLCGGLDNYPHNWKMFIDILNFMGVNL